MRRQNETVDQLIAFMHELADASGAAILPYFRSRLAVDDKSDGSGYDPVTSADRSAERVIRSLVKGRFPRHGVEGEEYGIVTASSDYRWLIDPIDGTRAFVLGLPIWGTLIGLMRGDRPLLGMMDQPFMRERFWTSARASCWRGPDGKQRRLKTRACRSLGDAMLTTTDPELFAPGADRQGFMRIKERVRTCRYGGDCYAYCMLAAGHIDVIIETGLKAYDVAALIPIIERAGGRVSSWEGAAAHAGGRVIACGDPRLHDKVLELLA